MSEEGFKGELRELGDKLRGTMLADEPLCGHTSYGIGGPALAFFYPADEDDLQSILRFADENDLQVFFIGSGSNLLVSDAGFDGLVINLAKGFKAMNIAGCQVFAQGGTMMGHFVKECVKHELSGVESLAGVPGTLGGAIRMNAGAYGGEISNFLKCIDVMTIVGARKRYSKEDLEFGYRYSSLPSSEVILAAEFEFEKASREEIEALKAKASRTRKQTQPLKFRSAGSVFKNPPNERPAGYLIDRAGLKGTKRGDAEISPKHANFFVNNGHASAEDMAWLIRLARKTVSRKFGVDLELEIKTLGFPEGYFEV